MTDLSTHLHEGDGYPKVGFGLPKAGASPKAGMLASVGLGTPKVGFRHFLLSELPGLSELDI